MFVHPTLRQTATKADHRYDFEMPGSHEPGSHEDEGPGGLKSLWRFMTTSRPKNRWVALWRSELPCEAGCPTPSATVSYLELDADLVVRGGAETYTCSGCGKRFLVLGVVSH